MLSLLSFALAYMAPTARAPAVPVLACTEALCHGCSGFATGPLADAVKDVGAIMNVTLIPFGNAKYSVLGKLSCQHGPDECVANSYEQCVIDAYPVFATHFPFYECLETKIDSGEPVAQQATECAKAAGLDIAEIEACVGDKQRVASLQRKFHDMTPPEHKFVPWVVVGGTLSSSGGSKLVAEVCKAYQGPKPDACEAALAAAAGMESLAVGRCDA